MINRPNRTVRRPRTRSRLRGHILSAAAGFSLALLILADPLGVLPLDSWRGAPSGLAASPREEGSAGDAADLWTCGMHPDVLQDHPGDCPICGMDLVPVRAAEEGEAASAGEASTETAAGLWTCGMHPEVLQDHPGDCPICGMDLVPVRAAEEEGVASSGEEGTSEGAAVVIDPAVVQNMGVVTAPARRRDLTRRVRTVGYLGYDQKGVVTVTTKFEGFVERVHVNYIGERVERGDPLFDIYSPVLVQTEQELLSSLDFARRMSAAPGEARERAEALVEAARSRLRYWDITPDQIDLLESTGKALRTLTVTSPASGVVTKRLRGLEGMAIEPGREVMEIADLSLLWLSAEVYEDQLPWVRAGSTATVSLDYLPGESFTGRVRFVEPEISEATRTARLTLEVPNPAGRLRAGMYATVFFEPVVAARALAVPSTSILRTGTRNVVVVRLSRGRFAPREVVLGAEGEGWVQVLSGLAEGEVVVTSSQFLIDSESNLREAIRKMIARRERERRAGS